jgi:hypothetical protein
MNPGGPITGEPVVPHPVTRARASTTRWFWRAGILPLLLALASCDPCFGMNACVAPHIYASGMLIWHLDGEPAQGVEVTFRPDPGAALVTETVRVTSNREGIFRLDLPTPSAGTVTGVLSFRPPEPYFYHGFDLNVRLETTEVRGDPQFLGLWGVGPLPGPPHLTYVVELVHDETGAAAEGVEVEFRRTAGISTSPESLSGRSDPSGRFVIALSPAGPGEVVGDLFVRPPAPYLPLEIRGVRMATLIGIGESRLLGTWRITR